MTSRRFRRILVAVGVGLLATALTTYLCVLLTPASTSTWRWDREGRAPNAIDGGAAAGSAIFTPFRTWHFIFLELDANTTPEQKAEARSSMMFATADDFEGESTHVADALRHTRAAFGSRYDDLIQHAHRLDIELMLYGFPARATRGGTITATHYSIEGPQRQNAIGPNELHAGELWVDQAWYMPLGARSVAYLPNWRGVAVNTAFYATIWMVLSTAPVALQRRLRRRRGLCPLCKYDLEGDTNSGCPECGWNRAEPDSVEATT